VSGGVVEWQVGERNFFFLLFLLRKKVVELFLPMADGWLAGWQLVVRPPMLN
jgi:hypothetical protein